jgi:DnaJ domain
VKPHRDQTTRVFQLCRLAVLFVLTSKLALSDTIAVGGYPFAVDRIENVDTNSLTLTLFGETMLVKRAELDDAIVRGYLDRAELFDLVQFAPFTEFLTRALREDRKDWVRTAVGSALATEDLTEDQQMTLVTALSPEPGAVDVFKPVLQAITNGPHRGLPVCRMIQKVAGADLGWVKANVVRDVFRFRVTCEELLQKSYLESVIAGDITNATLHLSIYGALYGIDSEGYQATLRLRGMLDGIVEGLRAANLSGAERSIATLSANPAYRREAPAIIDGLVAQFMSHALSEGKFGDALRFANLQSPDSVAPKVTVILRQTFTTMLAGKATPVLVQLSRDELSGLRVRALLDPEIRDGYLAYVTAVIGHLASEHRLLEALTWLDQLLSLRADPSNGNDELRIVLVEGFLDVGDIEKAQSVMADIQSSGHALLKLRVFFYSMRFGLAFAIVLGMLAFGFAVRFVLVRLSPLWTVSTKVEPPRRPQAIPEWVEPEPLRKFVSVYRSGPNKGGRNDPYAELLGLFGLTPGADLHAIKVAFRNSVKESHPDLTPDPTPEKTAKFIELKEAYERLLQLHEERAKK